jgi:hypothetical protein
MKRAIIFAVIISLALVSARHVLAAQHRKGTSRLSGVVIGPDDKPAAHATISYQYSDGSGPHAARADAHGRFTISHLPANSYDIRASARGVFSDWERNIPLRKGQTRTIELRLIYAKKMPKSTSTRKPRP